MTSGPEIIRSDKCRLNQRKLVNKMTNWQRSQWARAGYPDDLKSLEHYSLLERRPAAGEQ